MTKGKENNMQGSVQTKKDFSMNALDVAEYFGISQKDKKKKFRYGDPDNFYDKYFPKESAADSKNEEETENQSERMKKAFSMIEEAREIILEESQKIKAQESKNESRDQKESAADSVTEEKNNFHKPLEEQQKTIYTLTLRFTASEDKVRNITACLRANEIRIKVLELEKEVKEI